MSGEIYLAKNLKLNREHINRNGYKTEFKAEYLPKKNDIVPVIRSRGEDVELSKHIRQLLDDSNVNMGKVIFNAELAYKEPMLNKSVLHKTMNSFYITVGGGFIWTLNELFGRKQNKTDLYFKIQLKHVFAGKKNSALSDNISIYEFFHHRHNWSDWEKYYNGFRKSSIQFVLNAPTWKNFFADKPCNTKDTTYPTLNLILCSKPFAVLAASRPIIALYGDGYALTLSLKNVVDQRRKEMKKKRKQPTVEMVSGSGKTFTVVEQYLVEASPVLATMVTNPSFKEGRTKRVVLPELEDNVVEALVNWASIFDLSIPIKNMWVAVQMVELCEQYQMNMLKTALISILDLRNSNDFCLMSGLRLFAYTRHFPEFEKFSVKSLSILKNNKKDLRKSREYMEMFEEDPLLARELCTALIEY